MLVATAMLSWESYRQGRRNTLGRQAPMGYRHVASRRDYYFSAGRSRADQRGFAMIPHAVPRLRGPISTCGVLWCARDTASAEIEEPHVAILNTR